AKAAPGGMAALPPGVWWPRLANSAARAAAWPPLIIVSTTGWGGVCRNAAVTAPSGSACQPNIGAEPPKAPGPFERTASVAVSTIVFSAGRGPQKAPPAGGNAPTAPRERPRNAPLQRGRARARPPFFRPAAARA